MFPIMSALVLSILMIASHPAQSRAATEFDYSKHSIPVNDIISGGPPKDGIPSLVHPIFVPAGKATFLENSDKVIGITINGEAKAYPVKIMNWHEVVNDTLGGMPIMATW